MSETHQVCWVRKVERYGEGGSYLKVSLFASDKSRSDARALGTRIEPTSGRPDIPLLINFRIFVVLGTTRFYTRILLTIEDRKLYGDS